MDFRRTDCLLQVGKEKATPPNSISRRISAKASQGMARQMYGHHPNATIAKSREMAAKRESPFHPF
jgi:hypothetical protein